MPGSGDVFVSMGGGAWPCVVGGVLCKVGSFTNKELNLPIFYTEPRLRSNLVEGIVAVRETSLLLWVVARGLRCGGMLCAVGCFTNRELDFLSFYTLPRLRKTHWRRL